MQKIRFKFYVGSDLGKLCGRDENANDLNLMFMFSIVDIRKRRQKFLLFIFSVRERKVHRYKARCEFEFHGKVFETITGGSFCAVLQFIPHL